MRRYIKTIDFIREDVRWTERHDAVVFVMTGGRGQCSGA